jgi:N-acetyl-alpha-D-muramate 1-phosphate uridylyltransferase
MMTIAVLAGGFATRLGALVKDTPKSLLLFHGRPFVFWQIQLLKKEGYQKFVFCLSHRSEQIQEYLRDGSQLGVNIEYSLDGDIQLGTGGAIRKALPKLGSEFAVIYGDSYLPTNHAKVEEAFRKSLKPALMTVYMNNNLFDKSNVELRLDGSIDYNKNSSNSKMKHIDYGLTYFKETAFLGYDENHPFDLSELCSDLSNNGELGAFEVNSRFYEIGSESGISEFSKYLLEEQL